MKKTIYLVFLLFFVIINGVFAVQETLGTFKNGECIDLLQTCATCSYVNFTSIVLPDSTIISGDFEGTKIGPTYNYTFCNTSMLGTYTVNGIADLEGTLDSFSYYFNINPSGTYINQGTATIFISVISILIILILVCVYLTKFFAERESGMAEFFFIGIFIFMATTIRLSAIITSNTVAYNIINIIYRVVLYTLYFLFLVILVRLTMRAVKNKKVKDSADDAYGDNIF